MENLSVEFMFFFGRLLNWERSQLKARSVESLFLKFLILSGLGQWMNVSAFDLPHQSGGTNESQGTFEHKLTWVIFTGKGLRLNEALFEELQGESSLIWGWVILFCCSSHVNIAVFGKIYELVKG